MLRGKFREFLFFSVLLLLYLVTRLPGLHETFASNDAFDMAIPILKLYSVDWTASSIFHVGSDNPVARLLVVKHGLPFFWITALWVGLVDVFGGVVRDSTFTYSQILFGFLDLVMVYLIVKKLHDSRSAVISVLFLFVAPIFLVGSRFSVNPLTFSTFMTLLIIYFLLRHFEGGNERFLVLVSVCTGIYVISTSQFIGIFPLLVYISWLASKGCFSGGVVSAERKILAGGLSARQRISLFFLRAKKVFRPFFRPSFFLFPLLVLFVFTLVHLVVAKNTGVVCYDFIGHIFSGKETGVGFYPSFFVNLKNNLGLPFFILALVGVVAGSFLRFMSDKRGIFLVWALIYNLPFLLLIPDTATVKYIYNFEGNAPLIIFTGIFVSLSLSYLFDMVKVKASARKLLELLSFGMVAFVVAVTLLISVNSVLLDNSLPFFRVDFASPYGIIKEDLGAQAVGFWLRENVDRDAVVFSDAWGGAGIEPQVGQFYFGRRPLGLIDGDAQELLVFFEDNFDRIEYVVGEPDTILVYSPHFSSFFPIFVAAKGDRSLLVVYKKMGSDFDGEAMPDLISGEVREYNILFDEKYGNLRSLAYSGLVAEEDMQMGRYLGRCSGSRLDVFYRVIGFLD